MSQLLKIKLAYMKGKKPETKGLQEILDKLIDEVTTYEDFEILYKFYEGIVSYHKYYGGN